MPEHLTRERISALLDDPGNVPGELEHVAQCAECAREFEQMSRVRMALSALPDLQPPADEWDRIEARLDGRMGRNRGVFAPLRRAPAWPLQAAAVVALFAAGLMFGQRFGSESPPGTSRVAEVPERTGAGDAADPGRGASSVSFPDVEPTEAYLRTVSDLEELRDHDLEGRTWQAGPEAVATRITHLDAMIEASQEALREAPADPVLNNFLFQLVDERESLAGRLDRTLRMTAAEY
jgi:hypothetical protein